MPKDKKSKSELAIIMQENYPKKRFYSQDVKNAGKVLKRAGKDAVIDFLKDKAQDIVYDFKPPAKALIIAQSRPFIDWPIYKASSEIQSHIYALSGDKMFIPGVNKESIDKYITDFGINLHGYNEVSGLNVIFRNAKNIYVGHQTKIENLNTKNKDKIDKKNIYRSKKGVKLLEFVENKVFGEDGKLLHPPGLNKLIYCYSHVSPKPIKSILKYNNIPNEYIGYYRKPDEKIEINYINRFLISKDNPGYIPEWQYPLLNNVNSNLRRSHKWYSNHNLKPKIKRKNNVIDRQYKYIDQANDTKAKESLLCEIKIGEDWLLLDARGLLRNLRWRKIIPREGFSLQEILDQFTGDPIIDTERNNVIFSYKAEVGKGVGVHSENIISYKKSSELLKKLDKDICLVSIDLGQNNPMAVKFSKITLSQNDKLNPETLNRQLLPDLLLKEIRSYRDKTDEVRANINKLAIAELDQGYQDEFKKVHEDIPHNVIMRICDQLKIDMLYLPLDKMSSNTTYISDAYLRTKQDQNMVMFTPTSSKKNKTIVPLKRKDNYFARIFKLHVSKEARQANNEKLWDLQRSSKEYEKLSQRKKEFARRCVNYVLSEAKKLSKCNKIIINIENLNIGNGMFIGSDKREVGWNNFFSYKKENRWFVQAFHRAFSDLAIHRGMYVIESNPAYTSITCTKCDYCDKNNRYGEKFKCLNCEYEANADLDIALDNLEKVALTSKRLAKPCKQLSDAKISVSASKIKKVNVSEDIGNESDVSFVEDDIARAPIIKVA
jgi:hypothetical protein